jgi:hypothetical protein
MPAGARHSDRSIELAGQRLGYSCYFHEPTNTRPGPALSGVLKAGKFLGDRVKSGHT